MKAVIACSFDYLIGRIDDHTVLKYLQDQEDSQARASLEVEAQIYCILGEHDRILKFKGSNNYGILLQFAENGSLTNYLKSATVSPTTTQRVKWAQQAA